MKRITLAVAAVLVAGTSALAAVGVSSASHANDVITTAAADVVIDDNAAAPAALTVAQANNAAPAANNDNTTGPRADITDLAARVSPAVVSIRVETNATQVNQQQYSLLPPGMSPPQSGPTIGEGSGFFITADGYIVTNNHVVADAQSITVILEDGSSYPAHLIGTDSPTDLALIKIDADQTFPFLSFADQPARVGDWVMTVGNPYGLGGTVTVGIVSALGRNIGAGPYVDYMQIDAVINPGNSGGPAFNLDGQVIGVNSAIFSPTGASVGIGFSIPAHVVSSVVADLEQNGVVKRASLGVHIQSVSQDIAAALNLPQAQGAIIAAVDPNTPADAAGLQQEDVITAIDGQPVADSRAVARTVANHAPGDRVSLTIWRNGASMTVNVVLAEMATQTPPMQQAQTQQQPGQQVQGIGLTVTLASNIGAGRTGLAVVAIDPNGFAAETPLQPGDVILVANNTPLNTFQDLTNVVDTSRQQGDTAVLLRVSSNGNEGFVGLPIGN
jgi:serine protease Do